MNERDAILLPYQRAWVDDPGRFKIWLAARQIGKSFSLALEPVLDAVERRTLWVFLSAGERQARELAEKAKLHLDAMRVIATELMDDFFDAEGRPHKQLELRLPNGSRLVFLPANPSTARGYSGNVVLDEFAFHQDSHAIWAALFPTVTRSASFKLRIASTPNGKSNMFYRLWDAASRGGDGVWSAHRTDIYDAVANGLPVDPEELRAGLADDLAWQQEYLLEFVEETTAYLPYDLIATCEHPEAAMDALLEDLDPARGELYLGMDIGRQRDLSVIWLVQKVGDVSWTRRVIELARTSFAAQREVLYGLLPRARRACIDATGLGMQLAEEAKQRFGHVEPVTFSNAVKADLATTLRRAFEDRQVRIPIDDRIREDLHSVRRIVTSAGNIRFDAERDQASHADRFWALALALHAHTQAAYQPYERLAARGRNLLGATRR